MINYPRWTILVTLVVCVWGFVFAAPNFFEEPPSVLPDQQVTLGLDLQGGAHFLLEVEADDVIAESFESIRVQARENLWHERPRIAYAELAVTGSGVEVRGIKPADLAEARARLHNIDRELSLNVSDDTIRLAYSDELLNERRQNLVEKSIEAVRLRVDAFGVAEPTIQQLGERRIVLQMPGVEDTEGIKKILRETGRLTFHLVNEEASVSEAVERRRAPPGSMLLYGAGEAAGVPYVLYDEVVVGGEHLSDAWPSFENGQWAISFRFDGQGGQKFGQVTSENVGRRFAAVLDGEVVSAPVIRSAIYGGTGIITGDFDEKEATDLALVLRAGALPAELTLLEERTVGPGLGADSIAAGKLASGVGFTAVVLFMVASYGLFGIMASLALVINLALIVALMSSIGATLTLPGIAGIVLTIGMAVDANVLIFERIKEEARRGRSPVAAIDAGYRRALTTIIDSNLTTLIAALLLFNFGNGPIKGFAVTLSLGIVCSMFTAIMLTRLLVVIWLHRKRPAALPI